MRLLPVLATLAAHGLAATNVALAAEDRLRVDANLISGLDISYSVGPEEERLQREGLARAIADPAFVELIRTGLYKRVGFAAFAWSSHGNMKPVVPWTLVANENDAALLSNRLLDINLLREGQGLDPDVPVDHYEAPTSTHLTDIGSAIQFGSAQLRSAPFESRRAVINIIGNGPSNSGVEPTQARDAALQSGQVVNGLLFGPDAAGLVTYYRSQVIGGVGSFVMQVSRPETMSEALAEKFQMDIAGLTAPATSDAFLAFEGQPPHNRR